MVGAGDVVGGGEVLEGVGAMVAGGLPFGDSDTAQAQIWY